jgi:hypothetical protein
LLERELRGLISHFGLISSEEFALCAFLVLKLHFDQYVILKWSLLRAREDCKVYYPLYHHFYCGGLGLKGACHGCRQQFVDAERGVNRCKAGL